VQEHQLAGGCVLRYSGLLWITIESLVVGGEGDGHGDGGVYYCTLLY
jgi:hypothetical protein